MPLTDVFCRNTKPEQKTRKYADGGGLFLQIEPKGGKYWRLAYSFAGKQRTLALGTYPAVSLADARQGRDDAKRLLRQGTDPSAQKRLDKLARTVSAENTFASIAAELREKLVKEGRASGTMERHDRLILRASELIGRRPISQITAAEVLAVLRREEKKGTLATAGKLRVAVGQVFRYAISTARAETDPTIALRGALAAPTVIHRAAILDRLSFGGLLRGIWSYEGQAETRAALQLLALLYPRPGEMRMAKWKQFDLVNGVWTIPDRVPWSGVA